VYKIPAYQYIFLSTLDLGFLLEQPRASSLAKDSHRDLIDQRISGTLGQRILDSLKNPGDDELKTLTLGTFVGPEPEGLVLKREIEKACADGGKRIFTQLFLESRAPTIFDAEQFASLVDQPGMPPVTPAGKLPLNSGRSLHYVGARLRLFQSGVLGLEFRFGYNDKPEDKEAPLEAEHVITDIRLLEEDWVKRAAYHKLRRVFETLSQAVELKSQREFAWRNEWLEYAEFLRLSSAHRILLVKSLQNKDGEQLGIEKIINESDGMREISGVLNRAEWYTKYWQNYLDEISKKFIAYQNDEIFITDGDSSLIYFPSYWTRSKNKQQYVENIISAQAYLLSWDSLRSYFETYVNNLSAASAGLVSQERSAIRAAYEELTQAKAVVRLVRDALSVSSLVSHGFTARVLSQFLKERSMREKIDDLSQKLDGFVQTLTIAASFAQSERTTARSQRFQKIAILVGVIALLVSAFFSALGYFQRKDDMRLRIQQERQLQTPSHSQTPVSQGRRPS
jgi:hypothetical protein